MQGIVVFRILIIIFAVVVLWVLARGLFSGGGNQK
jgi:hypothetical protein